MSFLDKVADITARLLTVDVEMRNVKSETAANQHRMDAFDQKLESLLLRLDELGNRVTRLETQRESDLARLQIEVERAEMRLSRQLPSSN